jgi:hypothetical protein
MKIINFVRGIFCFVVVLGVALQSAEKTGPLELQNNAQQKKVSCLMCLEKNQAQGRQLLARLGHTESWQLWSGGKAKAKAKAKAIDELCLASLKGDKKGIKKWSKIVDVNGFNTVYIDHIQNGQRFSKCYGPGECTPLMCAVWANRIDSAIALLGGINIQNVCGQHAVMVKTAEKIDFKIDVNQKNPGGITALHIAAINSSKQWAIPLLLEHGAKINIQTCVGNTPLHASCSENIPVLIDHGADINIVNKDKLSPLYYQAVFDFDGKGTTCILASGALIDGVNKDGTANLYTLQMHRGAQCKKLASTFLIQGTMSKTKKPRQMRPLSFLCVEALRGNILGLRSCPRESYRTWSSVVQFLAEHKTVPEAAESLQQLFEKYAIEQKDRESIISEYAGKEATSQAYERVACYHGPEWLHMSAEKQIAEAVSVKLKRQEHVEQMLLKKLTFADQTITLS